MEDKSKIELRHVYGRLSKEPVGVSYRSWSIGVANSNPYVCNANNVMDYLNITRKILIKELKKHGGNIADGHISFVKEEDANKMIEYLQTIELMNKLRGGNNG